MATEKTLTHEEKKQILVSEAWARFPNMKKGVYFYRPWCPSLKVTSCNFEEEGNPNPFEYDWLSETLYYYGTAIFERGSWGEMLSEDIIELISSPTQVLLDKYKDNNDILKYIESVTREIPFMVERCIKNNERTTNTNQED